jgi:hypothetical protein
MVTLGTRLRNVAQGTGGIALAALMIGLALLMIVAGSFALEAWTG